MHKRALSNKVISAKNNIHSENLEFPDIKSTRANITTRQFYTSQIHRTRLVDRSASPIKNFDFIVSRCVTELKKIRKISTKLKKSTRKLKYNQHLIDKIIYKPLYSIDFLSKEKPKFLNKHLKYQ